jgi:hypothetical protein
MTFQCDVKEMFVLNMQSSNLQLRKKPSGNQREIMVLDMIADLMRKGASVQDMITGTFISIRTLYVIQFKMP